MGHYAKVQNGIVSQVIVAEAEFFDTFVDSSPGQWIQTSGLQMLSGTMQYNRYPSYHATHEVYAFLFWDTPLTLTEMEEVHNYYRDKLGTANMAAW